MFLFSLFVQFGPYFCKIAFNRVLLANGVKIVNGIVPQWNCLGYVSNFWQWHWHSEVGTVKFYGHCRFKSQWNWFGKEIRVWEVSSKIVPNKKLVHNPVGDSEFVFERYVSSCLTISKRNFEASITNHSPSANSPLREP